LDGSESVPPRNVATASNPCSPRRAPFDDPPWGFEPKLGGFRYLADTIDERLLSKQRTGAREDRPRRLLAVRPDGADHQWRKIPPRELSIDVVADERLGRVTGRAEAS